MPQIKVDRVAREPRTYRNEKFWGVECGGNWYDLYVEWKPDIGAIFDVNVTERTFKDKEGNMKIGRSARLRSPQPVPQQQKQPEPTPTPSGHPILPERPINQHDAADAALFYIDKLVPKGEFLSEQVATVICTLLIATFGKDAKVQWVRGSAAELSDQEKADMFDKEPWPDEHEWPEEVRK